MAETLEQKLERLTLLEQREKLKEGLPHIHGWPWYSWAKEFYESTHRYNILSAGNQISKSSTQIRKCIDWATDRTKWPRLWARRPLIFWYLYPSSKVAASEFECKWVPEFLPKGDYKDHPDYGWRPEYDNGDLNSISFNTGVTVFFKNYSQKLADLQANSVSAIFCDEECPEDLFDELNNRLNATDGYFHMVATPTRGELLWQELIEGDTERAKKFPDLRVWQISMYDCLRYEDGKPGAYHEQKIERIKNSCSSQAEINRRVYGRYVKDTGLKYPMFDRARNVKPAHPVPSNWLLYVGIDYGSGGEDGHPSAITFVAVSPDMKQARVVDGWRGDGIQTAASDVILKYQEMKGSKPVVSAFYDWNCKDLETIATRLNEPLQKADKSHSTGEQVLNVLFKNEMLAIYDKPELRPLIHELASLLKRTNKTKAKDDATDSLRYAVTRIPWDWSAIKTEPISAEVQSSPKAIKDRWASLQGDQDIEEQLSQFTDLDQEFDEWNNQYGN